MFLSKRDDTEPLLGDVESREGDQDAQEDAETNARVRDPYVERFAYMGIWLWMVLGNYAITRVLSSYKMPYDAIYPLDAYGMYDSISRMLLFGFVLGWFVGITFPQRFTWLFHWRRWYFFVLLFGVPPIYSVISNAEAMRHSTEDISSWSWEMYVIVGGGVLIILGVLVWHLRLAYKRKTVKGLLMYISARLAVIAYYVISNVFLKTSHHNDVHLHHYFSAWLVALFAEFNDPLSASLLGVSTAIFVQGVGAYTFAPIFNDPSCFRTVPVTEATCHFTSDQNFTINVCYGSLGAVPDSYCKGGAPCPDSNSEPNFIGGANQTDPFVWREVEPFEIFMKDP